MVGTQSPGRNAGDGTAATGVRTGVRPQGVAQPLRTLTNDPETLTMIYFCFYFLPKYSLTWKWRGGIIDHRESRSGDSVKVAKFQALRQLSRHSLSKSR